MQDLPDPSAVRRRVLAGYVRLRGVLARVETLAAASGSDPVAQHLLRDELASLLPMMDAHLALEEHILAPTLEQVDAFGDVRVDTLREHHRRWRGLAEALGHQLREAAVPPEVLQAWAGQVCAELRAELEEEERTLLRPEVLRDDLVTSGVSG